MVIETVPASDIDMVTQTISQIKACNVKIGILRLFILQIWVILDKSDGLVSIFVLFRRCDPNILILYVILNVI